MNKVTIPNCIAKQAMKTQNLRSMQRWSKMPKALPKKLSIGTRRLKKNTPSIDKTQKRKSINSDLKSKNSLPKEQKLTITNKLNN